MLKVNFKIERLSKETESLSKEIENTKSQLEILELKNTVTEINLMDGLNSSMEEREKKEPVNWETDQKLPKMNHREKTDCIKQEQSLRDRWDYNKRSNISVIRVLG